MFLLNAPRARHCTLYTVQYTCTIYIHILSLSMPLFLFLSFSLYSFFRGCEYGVLAFNDTGAVRLTAARNHKRFPLE